MSHAIVPILVVGSVALDAVHTPAESVTEVLGGAASYFCLSAAMFAPVRLVAVVGEDFPPELRKLLDALTDKTDSLCQIVDRLGGADDI